MKKNLFNNFTRLVAVVSLFSMSFSAVKAQNAADYGFQAVSGTYTEVASGTELFELEDDDMSSNNMIDLGFTFNFCGVDYTQVKPNSNGWLSFADVFPFAFEMRENDEFNLPVMTPMLQPLWDDQSGYSFQSGYFIYTTTGTSPNQVFTAEWRNWMWYFFLSTPTISYQVKLYEGSNVIEYIYRQESGFLDGFSEAATIGIANNAGDYQTLPDAGTNPTPSSLTFYTGINSKPATGQIYRWTPPPACTGTPVPGAAAASITSVNCEGDVDLSLTGNGIATQLEYQWEYSTDGGGSWLPIGSPQSSEYITFTVTETSLIRAKVTCLASGLSATSTAVTVTSNPPVAGASQAAPSLVCNGGVTELSTAGSTNTGVSYQWQSSPNNVTFTNISGATNPTYTTPGLVAPIYYRAVLTCDVNTATTNATSTFVDLLTNTAPAANPALSTITCGDSVVLHGTPSGNAPTVVWYDQTTGGSPVSVGQNVTLFPVTNTTYYVENSNMPPVTQVTSNNFAVVDHELQTGDDRGGIALSSQYLYVTGDNNTVRLNKFSLGNALTLPRRDGIFSTVSSQTVYCFGDVSGVDVDYTWNGGTIDRIYTMDASLNTVGPAVMLSQSFNIPAYSSYFIAPGDGYVLFMLTDFTTYDWYRIDLTTGNVVAISNVPLDMVDAESFASWGWAEFDGGSYHVVYNRNNNFEIGKMNLTTGVSDLIGSFSYLSDMACIAYDPGTLRMYFHYEGSSNDFGGTNETAGYTGLEVSSGCANNARTPIQVNVIPPVPTITPSGTFYICSGGNAALAASTGASYQWYLGGNPVAGATSQNYTATAPGNYTVEVTTADGCPGMSLATNVTVQTPQAATVVIAVSPNDTVCNGTPTTFTATPTNGGVNTSYQWKKNNVNVGTNSATYTTPALVNGNQIKVVMTVGPGVCPVTPTATSNTITMVVLPNVAPTVTIAANPGFSACTDDIIGFSTTPTNGGTAPSYQWQVNGSNVGTNSPIYIAVAGTLTTGDVVKVTMTSNQACALPTSVTQNVVMTVDPLTTPVIDIAADQTNVCQGTVVTFTATDNAPGGLYQWKVNGNPSGPNNAVYAYAPAVGDVISLDFTPPAAGCYENVTVTSNDIPVFVTPGLPTQATVTANPSGAAQGQAVVLTANLFNFSTSYTIDWYINGVLHTTTTVPFTDYVKGAGVDDIYAVVSGTGLGCYNVATTPNISVNEVPASVGETVSKTNIEIFPNPFSNSITVKGLTQGDEIRLMNMLGQTIQVWNPEKVTPEQVLKLTDLASGSYIISIRDKDGITQKIEKLQKM